MKRILITGASSGIGKAAAEMLHNSGHEVFLSARSEDKLKALAEKLGERAHIHSCDVRDYGAVSTMFEAAISKMGGVDVLLNNAGLGYFESLLDGSIEHWHNTIDTNVKGVLNCLHVALPHLTENHGHIINLGSVASHQVFPNSGVYCASKWAVLALSESIRTELADQVKITTISPGAVNTPFVDSTTNEALLKDYKPYFAAGLPVERIAEAIRIAVETPDDAVISEIMIRPNRAQSK